MFLAHMAEETSLSLLISLLWIWNNSIMLNVQPGRKSKRSTDR